ncbi:MAG: HAD family phosphatase [Elusimicrobia bacterium]|nr:HAD family phosphatase [Elusimicrobiota bacterium]
MRRGKGLLEDVSVVFFDMGNVLIRFDPLELLRRFRRVAQLPLIRIQHILWFNELAYAFEEGRVSPQEFFRAICGRLGTGIPERDFWRMWNAPFRPIAEMVEVVRRLGSLGIRRYVLSNTNVVHGKHLQEKHAFLRRMDGRIWSYEVGAAKPKPKIFRWALRMAGARPERCLFIDDRKENIRQAHALGMQTVWCRKPRVLARQLLVQLRDGG